MEGLIVLNQRLDEFYILLLFDDDAICVLQKFIVEFNDCLISGTSQSCCCIVQFLSKVLKTGRADSHPERHIGTISHAKLQFPVSVLNAVCDTSIVVVESICRRFHPCLCDYLLYFMLQLMSDVLKYCHNSKKDLANDIKISEIIVCLWKNTSTIDLLSCFKMLDIIGMSLQYLVSESDSNTGVREHITGHLRITSDILSSLSGRKDDTTTLISQHESCSLIDPSSLSSSASISAWWLSSVISLNIALKYLLMTPTTNDDDVSLFSVVTPFLHLLSSAMEVTSPCELLLTLSENDKDLLLFLLQHIEIRLRLEAILKRRNDSVSGTDTVGVKRARNADKEDSSSSSLSGLFLSEVERFTSVKGYDPVSLFYLLVGRCLVCDELLLLDLLTGPETRALEYLLRVSRTMSGSSAGKLTDRHRDLAGVMKSTVRKNSVSGDAISGSSGYVNRAVLWVMDEQPITSYEEASSAARVRQCSLVSGEITHSSCSATSTTTADTEVSLSDIRDTLDRLADRLEGSSSSSRASLVFNPGLLVGRLRTIVKLLTMT